MDITNIIKESVSNKIKSQKTGGHNVSIPYDTNKNINTPYDKQLKALDDNEIIIAAVLALIKGFIIILLCNFFTLLQFTYTILHFLYIYKNDIL